MKFKSDIEIQAGVEAGGSTGSNGQVLSSTGTGVAWIDQNTISAGNAEHVVIYAKNTHTASIAKGTPVYITGTVGATDTVQIAPADASDSAKMPAVGLLDETLAVNAFGYVITGGFMDNITTDPIDGTTPSSNDTVYVKAGGGLTLTKPTGPTGLIQNVAKVGKVSGGNSGSLIVSSILRTNDVPNLTTGKIWVGDGNTVESTVVHLDEVNGRMGIGTSSPGNKLVVQTPFTTLSSNAYIEVNSGHIATGGTDMSGATGIIFKQAGSGNVLRGAGAIISGRESNYSADSLADSYLSFYTAINNSNTERLRITSAGNVGIGTTSPGAKLEVNGITRVSGDFAGTGQNPLIQLYNTDTSLGANQILGDIDFYQSDPSGGGAGVVGRIRSINDSSFKGEASLTFFTGESGVSFQERLRITSAGRVGIGTTSPTMYGGRGMEVSGAGQTGIRISDTSGGGKVEIGSDASGGYIQTAATGNHLTFYTGDASTLVMRMSSAGNVGIGTTSPSQKLEVSGNAYFTGRAQASNAVMKTYSSHAIFGSNSTAVPVALGRDTANLDLVVSTSGNVGIGTTSPSEKLEVNGNIKADSFIKDGGTSNQFLKADGSVDTISYASTDNTYNKSESDSIFTSKTLSQNISFGESYASNYRSRVLDYGGTFFPRPLGYEIGLMKEQELFQKASLSLLPSGVGTGKVHNIKPKNDTFDFTRASTATYVDEDGLIQIAATNVPRLNYPLIDGVVSGCPSLLLEPQRINSLPYSEDFSNAAWIKSNATVLANQVISPDGTQNADELQVTTSGGNIYDNVGGSGDGVFSVFAKYKDTQYIRLRSTGSYVFFDIQNGVVGNTLSAIDAKIEEYPNGWYKCSVIGNNTNSLAQIFVSTDGVGVSLGNVYLWGADFQAGSYPTSYIPTSGTIATRSAETCNNAGDLNTFNDSEGVLFAEISALTDDADTLRWINLNDGGTGNRVAFYYRGDVNQLTYLASSSGTQVFSTITLSSASSFNKIAAKYKQNDFSLFVNGYELITDTIGNAPIGLNQLSFDNAVGGDNFYGNTKQIQYFPTALNDSDLETLTSWTSFSEMATSQLYTIE